MWDGAIPPGSMGGGAADRRSSDRRLRSGTPPASGRAGEGRGSERGYPAARRYWPSPRLRVSAVKLGCRWSGEWPRRSGEAEFWGSRRLEVAGTGSVRGRRCVLECAQRELPLWSREVRRSGRCVCPCDVRESNPRGEGRGIAAEKRRSGVLGQAGVWRWPGPGASAGADASWSARSVSCRFGRGRCGDRGGAHALAMPVGPTLAARGRWQGMSVG